MKVKIGDAFYSDEDTPIMLILSPGDKENISNMAQEATRYASFPDGFGTKAEMLDWMKTPSSD